MSPAEQYAKKMYDALATRPSPCSTEGGKVLASIDSQGNAILAPQMAPVEALLVADWITKNFKG